MFDFGIGASELMIIAVVALIVVGPRELPKVLRAVGRFVNQLRGMAGEFQKHLDAAMRDSGIDEVKKDVRESDQIHRDQRPRQADVELPSASRARI